MQQKVLKINIRASYNSENTVCYIKSDWSLQCIHYTYAIRELWLFLCFFSKLSTQLAWNQEWKYWILVVVLADPHFIWQEILDVKVRKLLEINFGKSNPNGLSWLIWIQIFFEILYDDDYDFLLQLKHETQKHCWYTGPRHAWGQRKDRC